MTVQVRKPFKPSPQQQTLFDWVRNGSGNAIVIAVAGSGKTTSLAHAIGFMTGSVSYMVFNKRNAPEMREKLAELRNDRPDVRVSTAHAAGMSAWGKFAKGVTVNENKTRDIVRSIAMREPAYMSDEARALLDDGCVSFVEHETFICKMVSFGKQFLMGVKKPIESTSVWIKLAEHFSCDQELPEATDVVDVIPAVQAVFRISARRCKQEIDFDDMIFAPIFYNLRFYQVDWVLLDEAQDINPARRELARRMLKPSGRLIAVGDDRQAIYGFTGAGADSLDRIADEFDCCRLPLTVTYRCPKSVVIYVQQWVSHIEAHESAPDGVVRPVLETPQVKTDGKHHEVPWFISDKPEASHAVLCRFTKPLVQTAYAMLREGHACKVEGRDIGRGLITLARRWKIKSLDALEKKLEAYLAREIEKSSASGSDKRRQDAEDRVETMRVFIARCRSRSETTIDALVAEIDALFADDVRGVTTLSTIHKSKGREWQRVYWLQATGGKQNLKPWEAVQEENLKYVAGTRAMLELVLVPEQKKAA